MQPKDFKNLTAKKNDPKEMSLKKDKKMVPKNELIRNLITEMVAIPKK